MHYSGAYAHEYIYADSVILLHYLDPHGNRYTPNDAGCDYYVISLEPSGRKTQMWCMDDTNGIRTTRFGYNAVYFEYDERGNEIFHVFLRPDGTPITPPDLDYAMQTDSLTAEGASIRTCYADDYVRLLDTACVWYELDSLGYITGGRYTNGKGVTLRTDRRVLDKYGNVISSRVFDSTHQLVSHDEWEFDVHNRVANEISFDSEDNVFMVIKYQYDDAGRTKLLARFDSSDTPWTKGYFGIRFAYASPGIEVRQYISSEGMPVAVGPDSISSIVLNYDRRKLTKVAYHDKNGMPAEFREILGWKLTFIYNGDNLYSATLWSTEGTIIREYKEDELDSLLWLLDEYGYEN